MILFDVNMKDNLFEINTQFIILLWAVHYELIIHYDINIISFDFNAL